MPATKRTKPDCVRKHKTVKRKKSQSISHLICGRPMTRSSGALSFKRVRCYHAIAFEPKAGQEVLKLRIKDVVFKMVGDKQYAEITVNGKTGQCYISYFRKQFSIPVLSQFRERLMLCL